MIKLKIRDKNMNNPKAAIEALLETDRDIEGITIYPITIARYGLLELIESPFIVSGKLFNIMNLIPSLYVMALPIEKLKKYRLRNIEELYQDAVVWSETLIPEQIEAMIKEIDDKIKTMFQVAPEISSDTSETHKGKKVQTAG